MSVSSFNVVHVSPDMLIVLIPSYATKRKNATRISVHSFFLLAFPPFIISFDCSINMNSTDNVPVAMDDVGLDGLEIMSEFISHCCVTVLAAALGAKTKGESFSDITYGRALVLLLYLFSWSFCTISIVVVSTNNCKRQYIFVLKKKK